MIAKDILVIGAGVAGLAVASELRRGRRQVTVLEQAPALGPVGAGLLLPPVAQNTLKRLDIHDEVSAKSARIEAVRLEAPEQVIARFSYEKLGAGLHALGTPRHVLFESLRSKAQERGVELLANSKVRSIRLVSESQSLVRTEDEKEYAAQVVIVADGSKSSHGQELGLRHLGFRYSHEALFVTGELEDAQQSELIQRKARRRLSGLLPIGAGQGSFFWGISQDETFFGDEKFQREARELMPEARKIIEKLGNASRVTRVSYRCSIHYPWFRNNVVLIGDAAHASTPHLGQGASLALQDASSLAEAILEKEANLEEALWQYQEERSFISSYYSLLSLINAPYFQSRAQVLSAPGDFLLRRLSRIASLEEVLLSTLSGYGPFLDNRLRKKN